jgi:hypothetical protein
VQGRFRDLSRVIFQAHLPYGPPPDLAKI